SSRSWLRSPAPFATSRALAARRACTSAVGFAAARRWGLIPDAEGARTPFASPRKKRQNHYVAEAAKNPGAPGRPGRLTPQVADAIVARVAGGDDLATAATAAGVGARTLRRWRRSAYSRDPGDADAVALERRIMRALATRPRASAPESWEEI